MVKLEVKLVPIKDLKKDPKNARVHGRGSIIALKASLEQFGQRKPVVATTDNVVIAGNGTLEAAESLGWLELAVSYIPKDWTESQIKAYALSDNRTAELSSWDKDLLVAEVAALRELGWQMDELGFKSIRLEEEVNLKEIPYPQERRRITVKRGDIYLLGKHRIMCGDSTDLEDVSRLMQDDLADCVWTDPPYNVNYVGGTDEALTIANDSMKEPEFKKFLLQAFTATNQAMKPGAAIYVCHADTGTNTFRAAFVESNFYLSQCLIWVKDHMVLSRSDYNWQHEPIMYGWKTGAGHSWKGTFNKTTIFDMEKDPELLSHAELVERFRLLAEASTIIREDRPTISREHPTMKPINLIGRMLVNSTKAGDLVYDPFLGAGSTVLAAEQLNRRAIGMDLEAKYVQAAITRWESLTEQEAVLLDG